MLSVRIVTSDHSMDDPIPGLDVTYSSFRGSVVKKVPVIRIFGPDSAGVKTCLHIHGVFPYIFVPCVEAEPDGKIQYQLASSLDLALNISLGQTSSTTQHVFKVVLVSGTPFYGYHQNSHQYYKIFFYNPHMVKKAAELLQSGAILNKVYQVHHCHIPYNLQFFIDYNLRGMDYISLEVVKYRRHPSTCLTPEWASEDMLLPAHVSRLSVSEVEADGMAGDIMNVRSMTLKMNPGLADIWEDEKQRRREEFRSSQITPPSSQQRPECAPTDSEIFFKIRIQENLLLMKSQQQESSGASSMDNSANMNTSIPYPVEVPKGANLINASYLDSHVVSSGVLATNLQCSNLNESFVDESMVLSLLSGSQKRSQNDSVLLDSQDMMFAEVLGELQEDQAGVDDDSILGTQLEKDCVEDDTDFLSANHEIVNTILEKNVQINSDVTASQETRQMWQESFWSGVDANCVVPQLDGTLESPDSTPGTSTNETHPLVDLVQPPNYWPFPELVALEPCNEGVQNHTNGNCEPCEEDLMDLSYSTATYSNISEPYNRVLLGDPALTSPPSATPSELGDCGQIANEFANNDQHFEGELMENLNFPDIGDLLEPNFDYSPIKDVRPFYTAEMNGNSEKKNVPKANVKRKHSKANKVIPTNEQSNGTLDGPIVDHIVTDNCSTDDMFQQPQQALPFTNGGYYYEPIPLSPSAGGESARKAKVVKKPNLKRKSVAVVLAPETTENNVQKFQTDAAVVPMKKVTARRKSTSVVLCTGASCYEDSINQVVLQAMEESESTNTKCILPLESDTSAHLSDSYVPDINGPQLSYVEAVAPIPLALADEATRAAIHNGTNKDLEKSRINELTEKEATLSDCLTEKKPSSISVVSSQDTNKVHTQEKRLAPAGLNTLRKDSSMISTQHANKISKPAALNTISAGHHAIVCKQPSLSTVANNSLSNVLHNKTLPSISITAVKRNQVVVPDHTLSKDPSVLRTKSLPGISLTVNKKKAVVPSTIPRIQLKNTRDTCSMVAIGNHKKTSVPKILHPRPPISCLKKEASESKVAKAAVLKPDSFQSKTIPTTPHLRSPLALVRREDDLTLAQLIKLEKTKEKSSPIVKIEERKCSRDKKSESFEIAVSKTTALMVKRSANVQVLHGDSMTENICVLDERCTMTVKDMTNNYLGVDCCLKVAKSSSNSISLADLLRRVTDAYNSPNPTRLTFFKDMCEQKFHFESVEIQAVNGSTNGTEPESASARIKTEPESCPSTSNVSKKKCSLPKTTLKRKNHKKKPSNKHVLNNRRKASITLASREIMDTRLIALFETRTGQTINRDVEVAVEVLSDKLMEKYELKRGPKQFKVPCVDGGVDSDLSSSEDDRVTTSQPRTPKRRKGRYRPLAVQFEKSPKGEASKSAASVAVQSNVAGHRNRQKRGSYGALDVRFDKSPSSRQPSQLTASSSSFGIQPNSSKDPATTPDLTIEQLSSDDLEAASCRISQSKCDDTIRAVQSETGCDQNIFNENSICKTAKKKLTFPSSNVNQEMYKTNVASNSSEKNISVTLPARRSSFDIFGESHSPQMFPSSGDTGNESGAQSPIDTAESIGALELISDDEINDLGIVSFYDNTHIFSSPSDTTFHGSPQSSDIVSSGEALVTKMPLSVGKSTHLGEPVVHHQEPFYSDPADVTAGIQVGHRNVKLLCGPSLQMPQNHVPASVGQGPATITPCQRPPSYAEVERWTKARKLLKAHDAEARAAEKPDEKSLSSQSASGEALSKASISLDAESPLSCKTNQLEFSNATSTPQSSRRTRISSPTYTPIVDIKAKLRSSKKKSLASFKPQEPSIEEVDESESPKESPKGSPKPSTSKETPRRVVQRRRSSVNSIEDPSLHKLLLQSQFRQQLATPRRLSSGCQIEGVQNNTFGFRMSLENLQDAKALTQHQHVTVMLMELHVQTRGDLRPDPAHDPIRAVFYFVVNDVPDSSATPKSEAGGLAVCDSDDFLTGCGLEGRVRGVSSERELIDEVVKLVRRTDPDIFCGYETEMLSWGYLIQRAATLQINLCPLLSRMPTLQREGRRDKDEADDLMDGPADLRLPGRVLLNVWRLMKSEIALMNYSFENVVFHILHQRVPLHSFRSLSLWWEHRSKRFRWLTAEYYETRVRGMVRVMDQLDLIGRTSELARIFGIQFYEVLSRGSQFRVESMMLRLAKPLDYVPVSPSIHQRAQMRAPECVPLIMEPESTFYADPVVVLDFQSLYPSIIIAYNYCYSTCLGRVEHLGKREPFAFGCTSLKVPPRLVEKLSDKMNVSPNGVAFVQEAVRRGVLPRMLQEILDTRLMVKKSMKDHAGDKTLQRVLHSRQLGLKLIANVTYGYTSANFSGRMPCIEVGDSVVSKGRETLERAIRLVQQTERWGAKVVYGDTDSLFVLLKGRSREQAFAIGAEIADAVTRANPKPVKLKLEKVYHPCILQTKKRYVGYLYESPDQSEPRYDAKGIETVRRDGCPAVAKMLEKCLRLLFETRDVSLVKRYVCRQFDKLLRGRANVHDLIFAREYRGMAGYKPGACVPALELTRRWLRADRRSEPRVGERVPYVIVAGAPGLPLIRLVRSPHELLSDPSLRINAVYYITRAIVPALNRCLLLIGADALAWFASMPRKVVSYLPTTVTTGQKKSTISQYFATTDCAACARPTSTGLCANCAASPQATVLALNDKVRLWERNLARITQMCESCVGRSFSIDCMSLDCPVMFRKYQAFRDQEQAPFVRQLIDQF